MSDPCFCANTCPHGETCGGAHARPCEHWWSNCDVCTPKAATGYLLPDGRTLMVVTGCGHAIGPGRGGEVSRAAAEHKYTCTGGKLT